MEDHTMTRARYEQISTADTPYYHCIARCVRRAFLCGEDTFSGQSYEHRRQWILDRLTALDQMFAVDVCAYAIMSNHYHLVLYINQAEAESWSEDEVIRRWLLLFKAPVLIERYQKNECSSNAERKKATEIIEDWRQRLMDISWFMRCLNEYIARKSNEEDGCTGRFWEGRFKSQALLDEQALLTCMAYVDLNPVRAGLADRPEHSDFTSVQQRIRQRTQAREEADLPKLKALSATQAGSEQVIPFDYADYLTLVDWAGRCQREDKHGSIPEGYPPILQRLNIDADAWLKAMRPKGMPRCRAVGRFRKLQQFARNKGLAWISSGQQLQAIFR
ncbi:transposase [Oceanospirillum linum]|nr:transposase [Oceanospirillum linum]